MEGAVDLLELGRAVHEDQLDLLIVPGKEADRGDDQEHEQS